MRLRRPFAFSREFEPQRVHSLSLQKKFARITEDRYVPDCLAPRIGANSENPMELPSI